MTGRELTRDHFLRLGAAPKFADARLVSPEHDSVIAWVKELLRGDRSKNFLLLAGPTGTAKTYTAWAAIKGLIEQGYPLSMAPWGHPWPFLARSASDLMDGLRPEAHKPSWDSGVEWDVGELARMVNILLIDDLGTEKVSEFTVTQLETIINGRYENQKATIVTTNIDPSRMAAHIGERSASRFCEASEVVYMDGQDRRTSR